MTRASRRRDAVLLALATIVAGLAVHFGARGLPPSVRDIAGDALWAAMMFWWLSALLIGASRLWRGIIAFAVCALVELSQLVHTPWIDALRATTVGHLVLGSGFDPRDFVAYALGVAVAMLLARMLRT